MLYKSLCVLNNWTSTASYITFVGETAQDVKVYSRVQTC